MTGARTILHIGTHKTGTTSIQHLLGQMGPALAEHGTTLIDDYSAVSGQAGPSHQIAKIVCEGLEGPDLESLKAALQAAGPTRLLSSEVFFRYFLPVAEHASIADKLRSVFGENLEFVLYIRDFAPFFNSLIAEQIHSSVENRPKEKLVRYRGAWFRIEQLTDFLSGAFGDENVHLVAFDTIKTEGNLIAPLLRIAGLPDLIDTADRIEGENKLHSMLPVDLLRLKFRLNQLSLPKAMYTALRRHLGEISAHYPQQKYRILSDTDVDWVIREARKLNPNLASLLGRDEALLFSDSIKTVPYEDLDAFDPNLLATALLRLYQQSVLKDPSALAPDSVISSAANSSSELDSVNR